MKGTGLSIRRKSNEINTNMHRYRIPELIDLVVEQIDIVLEVLDARFIEKTRNFDIEQKLKKLGKTIIYVLNKSDLVNIENVKKELESNELRPYVFFSCKNKQGIKDLKEKIRSEAKKFKKDSINFGVIGYPNTGKSSIINILAGRAVAGTSSQAGYTKGLKKIRFSAGLYLIDTPGIIPFNEHLVITREHIIKHFEIGARTWDKAGDPEMVVHYLMKENAEAIEKYYNLDVNGDSEALIETLGRKLCYLKKGNVVDTDRTARRILRDWQEGQIRAK